MPSSREERPSEQVRNYVEQNYIRHARRQGKNRFSVRAGDIHSALGYRNRLPLVCSALRRERFLQANHLKIVDQSGPPSGMSTTVTITYEFIDDPGSESKPRSADSLLKLRGLLRDVFRELGGGENFIRSERQAWEASETEDKN